MTPQPQTNSHPTWCDQTTPHEPATSHPEDTPMHKRGYRYFDVMQFDDDPQPSIEFHNIELPADQIPALAAALLQAHNDILQPQDDSEVRGNE